MTKLAFLDVETTSLDDRNGAIWEIGLIVRAGGADVEYWWQINANLEDADPQSLQIGHYYPRNQARRFAEAVSLDTGEATFGKCRESSFRSIARSCAELLNGAHVFGANPGFDYRFMRRFLADNRECWTAHYHLHNIRDIAAGFLIGRATSPLATVKHLPSVPWKAREIYAELGVNVDDFDLHTALGDARLVRAVHDAIFDE